MATVATDCSVTGPPRDDLVGGDRERADRPVYAAGRGGDRVHGSVAAAPVPGHVRQAQLDLLQEGLLARAGVLDEHAGRAGVEPPAQPGPDGLARVLGVRRGEDAVEAVAVP